MWYSDRDAHYAYNDGCHVFHYHATPFSFGHDTLISVKVGITEFVLGGIPDQSDYMHPNNWIGGTLNFQQTYWHNQCLNQPPSNQLCNTPLYRNWVANFQPCPPKNVIEDTIHEDRYNEQVTNHVVQQFLCYDGGDSYMEQIEHTLCVLPGNWLDPALICCHPHFFDKQVTDPLKTGGPTFDRYQRIKRENETQGHGLQGRLDDMEEAVVQLAYQLSTGDYIDPELIQVEGKFAML